MGQIQFQAQTYKDGVISASNPALGLDETGPMPSFFSFSLFHFFHFLLMVHFQLSSSRNLQEIFISTS